MDPLQSFHRTATLDELVTRTISARRFALVVLAGFAALALVLAAAGLYGVLTAIALQYRREIGVRMAIGATWIDILRLMLGRGLAVVGAGVLAGIAGVARRRPAPGVVPGQRVARRPVGDRRRRPGADPGRPAGVPDSGATGRQHQSRARCCAPSEPGRRCLHR